MERPESKAYGAFCELVEGSGRTQLCFHRLSLCRSFPQGKLIGGSAQCAFVVIAGQLPEGSIDPRDAMVSKKRLISANLALLTMFQSVLK